MKLEYLCDVALDYNVNFYVFVLILAFLMECIFVVIEACIFAPVLEEQGLPTLIDLLVFMLQSKFVWTLKNVCIFTLQVNCI